jgi:hypothetical protein
MTTDSHPPVPVDRRARKSPWIPRSRIAFGVLLLTAAAAITPAYVAGIDALFGYLCFDVCLSRSTIAVKIALCLGFLLAPFAAVRCYQGVRPPPAAVWLAAVLAADLLLLGWSVWYRQGW